MIVSNLLPQVLGSVAAACLIMQYAFLFIEVLPNWNRGDDDWLPRKKRWFWFMLIPVLPMLYFLLRYLRNVYKQLN